jgi:hypothetical protein
LLAWAAGTAVILAPLVLGLIRLRQVTRRAVRITADDWTALAASLAGQLGLTRRVTLLRGRPGDMPMTWGLLRPMILLPHDAAAWSAERRRLVLLHELAHVQRRDCLTQLLAHVACALYWFHPLAWLAARQLRVERERACDDQVLNAGSRASDYAWHLLEIARSLRSARGIAAAAVAMARPSQLEGRLLAILDTSPSRRTLSPAVVALAGVAVLGLLWPLAILRLKARAEDPKPATPPPAAASPQPVPEKPRSVHGSVRDSAGKPVAGAHVYWVGVDENYLGTAAPKGRVGDAGRKILTSGTTDAEGRFKLSTAFPTAKGLPMLLAVTAPGLGLEGKKHLQDGAAVIITMRPEVKIEGQFLTPSGTPAKGCRIRARWLSRGEDESLSASEVPAGKRPPYWPEPAVTDEQGRFTLGGVAQGTMAILTVTHPDFAREDLTVDTGLGLGRLFASADLRPLAPKFKHTLQPARPVQGVVTAADTGKPLAGVVVEVTAWRRYGGQPIPTRTDAQGRYRVSGYTPDNAMIQFTVTVFPAPDSGYLSVEGSHESGWPAGAKVLEKNFALPRGRVIRGRVTDGDTGRPIAGASVIYQPKIGNPNRRRNLDLRNPVLTDQQGQFVLTGLAGDGVLVAEGPSPDYMRVTLPRRETGQFQDLFPHGYTPVSVPAQGDATPVSVTLRKGVTLEAHVVKPDGKPVPYVYAGARELSARQIHRWPTGERCVSGKFRWPGCDPKRTYRVFFVQPDLELGAVAELKYDPTATGPVEIRLQPTASVRGRLLTADGVALSQGQVYPDLLLTKEEGTLTREDYFFEDRLIIYVNLAMGSAKFRALLGEKPNARGEFHIRCLIPDAKFFITGTSYRQELVRTAVTLKPGEVKNLGDLTVRKEKAP